MIGRLEVDKLQSARGRNDDDPLVGALRSHRGQLVLAARAKSGYDKPSATAPNLDGAFQIKNGVSINDFHDGTSNRSGVPGAGAVARPDTMCRPSALLKS